MAEALIASAAQVQAQAQSHDAEALRLYGRFIGSWDVDLVEHLPDGTTNRGHGEWHWGWVLEGRAVQDVWIAPPRAERPAALAHVPHKVRYGTTIRSYDTTKRVWYVTWNNPPTGDHVDLIARADQTSESELVQEGQQPDGTRKRWTFRDITPDSFRWIGEASNDEGRSWDTEVEMWARRRSAR